MDGRRADGENHSLSHPITLADIDIDISIVRAVNKWCTNNGFKDHNPYWDEDNGFTIVDYGLLPLNRLENMMSGTFEVPPVFLRRRGDHYEFDNGRHRIARLIINNACNSHYVLSASEYVVEKNPGPPKKTGKTAATTAASKNPTEKSPKKGPSRKNGAPKSKAQATEVAVGLATYKFTAWYTSAVSKGFKSKLALDRFNATVLQHQDEIDPTKVPVCCQCGHSDIVICSCMVEPQAPATVDLAEDGHTILIPTGPTHIKYRFDWVNRVKRMFVWPNFNVRRDINHNIGFMKNSDIPEETMLMSSMLAYIRLGMNTSYTINGVHDRAAKLAHAKKLGLRFLDENDVELDEKTNPEFVNKFHFTVQRATDMNDDSMLFQHSNQEHGIWNFLRAPSLKTTCALTVAVGLIILLAYRPNMVNALRKEVPPVPQMSCPTRLTLLTGRKPIPSLDNICLKWENPAPLAGILNSVRRPFLIGIQQLSWPTAHITSMRAYASAISNVLLTSIGVH